MNTVLQLYTSRMLVVGIMLCILPTPYARAKTNVKVGKQAFDYIVIGSCAGAVVANRLTDDKKTSVLLLEAGDKNNTEEFLTDSSKALLVYSQHNPEVIYQGQSKTQELLPPPADSLAQGERIIDGHFDFVNSRVLGGNSSTNGEQVVFGTSTYWDDKVANIGGDDWSSVNVYARYKDLENYKDQTGQPTSPDRGTEGPWKNVTVPTVDAITPDAQTLFDALLSPTFNTPKLPQTFDYNTLDKAKDVGPFAQWDMQQNFDDKFSRVSAATAFLGDAVVDQNGNGGNCRKLCVRVRSTAISLLWDEDCPTKVIGVRYTKDGTCHDVYARKEVILAAGLLTAPFLQRNGIGPVDVLSDAGVAVRVASEHVGKHIRNHIGVPCIFAAPGVSLIPDAQKFAIYGPGAFLPNSSDAAGKREIQWNIADLTQSDSADFIEVLPLLLVPQSEGTISIQSADPLKVPLFKTGYLTDEKPQDFNALLATLTGGASSAPNVKALDGTAFGAISMALVSPTTDILDDEAALRDFINDNLVQMPHYTGGAIMGTSIADGVVDNHGKVFGVRGLRVADLSILPYIPDGSTTTPAILVGWSIADFIKAGK